MILQSTLENCVAEQKANMLKQLTGVTREQKSDITIIQDFITIITGIRRCGKSTLMLQMIKKLGNDYAYFNFEDPRIVGFETHDFEKLEKVLGDKKFYFFDEIQNIENWEIFIRKLHDRKKAICITGSNASLLSKELGTRLTGRNIQKELFPFSYREFCKFFKLGKSESSLEKYIQKGGFPAFLQHTDTTYLQQLFRDILYRDIIVRHGVRNAKLFEQLSSFLISNIGSEYSLNKLKNIFGIGSANSVADYISWLEDSYLLFSLPRFSWSLKSIAVNPKKIYAIDTGFINANSQSFSKDRGRLLENAVYLHLRKSRNEIFYFREKGECDFLVKDKNKITEAIQVCYDLNTDNLSREMKGLEEAMELFQLKKGTLITFNQKDTLHTSKGKINVIPASEWMY